MSKFHSTVSRRAFMKGLGLAGAGLGAAAAAAPVFHDLDEVMAAPTAGPKHPWYVKELELEKPTVEIDWSIKERWDRTFKVGGADGFPINAADRGNYPEINATVAASQARKAAGRNLEYMQEKFPSYQGPSLRDYALTGAGSATRLPQYGSFDFLGRIEVPGRMGTTVKSVGIPTPESRGMTKWQGTPEESLRTLQSAARFFGASDVGCVELTANTRKMVFLNDTGGKPYNFKDADVPEETDTEYVIPNKCKYVLFFTTLEATSQVKQAPSPNYTGYDHYGRVVARIHYFLGALGYQHIDAGGVCSSNSFGALSGVGEHSRASMILTSYKYGNLLRGMHRIFTDLPLSFTRPIDAGIAKFCETCKTCATECPYDALPIGDKRWDHEDPEENSLPNYTPGYKGWRLHNLHCVRCKNCHGTCPFNAADDASVHMIVRATQATTSIFNSFFVSMHRTFGYGTKNPDDWWETDVPTGFFDPSFIKH